MNVWMRHPIVILWETKNNKWIILIDSHPIVKEYS